eukprot:6560279-Alexandrium_andersonii.AAC.1
MQHGQEGRAQRCDRKLALQMAWEEERWEQQWWAARPWVPEDVRGGNTAVQIPRRLRAAYTEYKLEIMQQLIESYNYREDAE